MRFVLAAVSLIGLILMASGEGPAGEQPMLKPINLEQVNTEADEDDPYITMDGLALYYASNGNKVKTFDLYVSQRRSPTAAWSAGKRLKLNDKEADARSPFLWRGTLYFTTNKVPEELKAKQNFDLYQITGTRAPLPLLGVSEKEDELAPWITRDGRQFYFSRKTEEGWRLFVAQGPVPGPIGKAKMLDFPAGFHHATISANGLTMYLQGPLPNDRWGLFRATRNKTTASWLAPQPLERLNHPDGPRGDLSPTLSADGSKLYFASDRPGGKGGLDLWMVATAQLKAKTK